MIRVPVRAAALRSAEQRGARAARLRLVLGPTEGWPAEWRVELEERLGLADSEDAEVVEAFRAELLRRMP